MDETELDLARRAAAGEAAAFEAIMRRHNRMLFRAARAILRDEVEAEDCLQSAYLLAFRSMGSFAGRSKLSTWLTRIVINEALGRARRLARHGVMVPIEEQGDDTAAAALACAGATPEEEAIRGDVRRSVLTQIDALPDRLKAVFVLRAVRELSVGETAQALGITGGTVRTRFFRARNQLRKALAGAFA